MGSEGVGDDWRASHETAETAADGRALPPAGTPTPPDQDGLAPVPVETRRRLRRVLLVLGCVVVAGAVGALGFVAWSNYDRAGRWEARAERLERNNRSLNGILISRSQTLNARTRELNAMAAKVKQAAATIARSEADVRTLERRQHELANEKAQVEDERSQLAEQRNAIEGVAAFYIDCKNGLIDLLNYVTNDDYASAEYYVSQVASDCQYAENALQDYSATYGD